MKKTKHPQHTHKPTFTECIPSLLMLTWAAVSLYYIRQHGLAADRIPGPLTEDEFVNNQKNFLLSCGQTLLLNTLALGASIHFPITVKKFFTAESSFLTTCKTTLFSSQAKTSATDTQHEAVNAITNKQ